MSLSIFPCQQNLAAFQDSSFQQVLIPSTLQIPTNLWKGQSSWGHNLTHFGPFPHSPCSQLPPHTHSQGWCRQRGHREDQELGGSSSITLSFLQGNWTPAPALISSAICWDCPLLGQGKLGSHHSAADRGRQQRANKITAPYSLLAITSLMSWWSLSEKWFLMAPVISEVGLPSSVQNAL